MIDDEGHGGYMELGEDDYWNAREDAEDGEEDDKGEGQQKKAKGDSKGAKGEVTGLCWAVLCWAQVWRVCVWTGHPAWAAGQQSNSCAAT